VANYAKDKQQWLENPVIGWENPVIDNHKQSAKRGSRSSNDNDRVVTK